MNSFSTLISSSLSEKDYLYFCKFYKITLVLFDIYLEKNIITIYLVNTLLSMNKEV